MGAEEFMTRSKGKTAEVPADNTGYSFCESIHAGAYTPWHIRKLSEAGRKLGGGVDTTTLCGITMQGWDRKVEISNRLLKTACVKCVGEYERLNH